MKNLDFLINIRLPRISFLRVFWPCACKALPRTEIHVLQLILAGRAGRDIAVELHRSKRTIDVHRRDIMRKLEASSPVDLVRQAMRMRFFQSRQCRSEIRQMECADLAPAGHASVLRKSARKISL